MYVDAKLIVVKPWEREVANDSLCMPISCLSSMVYENIDFILIISLSIHVPCWTCINIKYIILVYKSPSV